MVNSVIQGKEERERVGQREEKRKGDRELVREKEGLDTKGGNEGDWIRYQRKREKEIKQGYLKRGVKVRDRES